MDELTLAVVGIDFPNSDKSESNRRAELLFCNPGDRMALVPEPKNAFDENAVAVFAPSGIQVGYLTAERAPYIGSRISREPYAAVFQGMADSAAYIRLRFGGGAPTLPPPAEAKPPAPVQHETDEEGEMRIVRQSVTDGFYPDPEGPEWGA